MNRIRHPALFPGLLILLLGSLVTACGGDGGRNPFFSVDATTSFPPQVTAVTPVNGATGVATNVDVLTAAFSTPMAPITDPSNFTVTCEAPCTSPTGNPVLSGDGTIATYTLDPGSTLEPSTLYTATVTGFTSLATGREMQGPFVWQFTTGTTADVTRPRVTATLPETSDPGPTLNVAANTAVSVTFTEDMDPSSVDASSFSLVCDAPCASPAGAVSYDVGSRTAVFDPGTELEEGVTYTATLSTDITDMAGNQLAGNQEPLPAASDYVWEFVTTAPIGANDISVSSVTPEDLEIDVCPNASVSVTFDVPSGLRMDPNTVDTDSFKLTTGTAPAEVAVLAESVLLDSDTGTIATFIPLDDLTPGETYTVTVSGLETGVRDLATPGNSMISDFSSSFTVGPDGPGCLEAVALNSVAPFGTFGGSAGMTNTGIQTIINGDIGTIATDTSSVTGFHDENGDVYTESPDDIGAVNGLIYTCTTSTTGPTSAVVNPVSCDIATDARLDAEAAYLELAGLPGGPDPGAGNLANLTLAPGVYTAGSGSFMIEGGDLTLDAQGDANAVWVFQMATTLRVGGPGAAAPQSIILANGAQAKNVFWQVGSAATINAAGGGTMAGTIIAEDGVSFSTADNTDISTLNGRAISLGASVTMVDTVINVPAP